MKVVEFESFGAPHEVAACVDAPDPGPPADDEVVVEVEAFPINPVDLLTIAGRYATRCRRLPAPKGRDASPRSGPASAG